MARFFKTGADATSAAVRLARFITKRDPIVTVGYNGWHDHFMFDTPGVPAPLKELTQRLPLFTPEDEDKLLSILEERASQLAAVVLSIPYNRCLKKAFFAKLRDVCSRGGALLVSDEIVTGFRLALGGAQEYFGFNADLVCYSKALAAGLPLSAVVGPRHLMTQMADLQVSTTFGGDLLALAVCEATLKVYKNTDYIQHIASLGKALQVGVNRVAIELNCPLRVGGYDAIPFFMFDSAPARHIELMRRFQGEMAQRGVLLRRDLNFIAAAHTEEQIRFTIDATRESLQAMHKEFLF
jgi:aminotransferase MxcL